ncbi:MAG: RrF2 family transcriptional regulator [Candidatus Omnitrophica bacterium]|nr:RrF2 family transcriptional regulator [Candidatus Omnitrophota bacterium]
MKVTTGIRYGLRAAVQLAKEYRRGPVSVSLIARNEKISTQYLEQLLNRLKRGGVVKSIRGPQGGYMLMKNPKNIRVYDVVKSLEGDMCIVFCMASGSRQQCNVEEKCSTKMVWQKVNDAIVDVLRSISLEDLCGERSRK